MSYLWKSSKGRSLPPVMHRGGPVHDAPIRSGKERYAEAPAKDDKTPQICRFGRLIIVCDHETRLVAVAVIKSEGRLIRNGMRGHTLLASDPLMLVSLAGTP